MKKAIIIVLLVLLLVACNKKTEINDLNNKLIESITDAAIKGDLSEIEFLIKAGADINAKYDDKGYTALMYAARYGYTEIVQYLISVGVDVNIQCYDIETALSIAIENGHTKIVEMLIAAGAEEIEPKLQVVELEDFGDELRMAARDGYLSEVEKLIGIGVDVNMQNNNGRTALMMAAGNGYFEIVELLIEAGADNNLQDINGYTALKFAAGYGRIEIVEFLINIGACRSRCKFERSFWLSSFGVGYSGRSY